MSKSRLYLLLFVLIFFLLPPTHVQADSGVDPNTSPIYSIPLEDSNAPQEIKSVGWYDGLIQYSQITNCPSIIQGLPYSEYGMGAYAGFSADPEAAQPGPGQIYYIHAVIYGLGNACSGQRAYIDVQLPANTSLAISAGNPVRCYAGGNPISPASDCPQVLPSSPYNPGAYAILSTDTAHARTWPVPQGGNWEFQIPVVSSTTLTNSTLRANVWALDGNGSPWLRPTIGVYVFSTTPTIIYPSPSTAITAPPNPTYTSRAYVYTFGMGGTAYFDLGTSTSYGLVTDSAVIPVGGNAWIIWDDWLPFVLQSNTTYHWRIRFLGSNGQTYYGTDQTFTTYTNGLATVGSGAAASCTISAFNTALATPGLKKIDFNCGAQPVTIILNGAKTVSSNLEIEGGNKVTLDANNGFRLFDITNSAILTLKNITLKRGNVTGCGGAVHIQSGARLDTYQAFFVSNHANGNGGAICVESGGVAALNRSQLTGNSASGSGGAFYNQGISELRWSDISSNSAQVNGGGLWNNYILDVLFSLVANNSLPTGSSTRGTQEGGGIYNIMYGSISTSTVSGNTANHAAGIYNKNGDFYINSTTIGANTAAAAGAAGGLESTGTGHSFVRNTLIANNLPGNCGTISGKTISSNGNNLDSGNQCIFNAVSDKINTNPRLQALANNGGISRTMALSGGSPAIDAADKVYCAMYDQRGFNGVPDDIVTRNVDGNGDGVPVCDIGAFEYFPHVFLPLIKR